MYIMIKLKTLISEQKPDKLMPYQPDNPMGDITTLSAEDRHALLNIGAVAVAVVPVIGLAASAGLELLNAGLYWAEGNTYDAGLYAVFAAIPVIGQVAGKFAPAAITYLKNSTNVQRVANAIKTNTIAKLDPIGKQIVQVFTKNANTITVATKKWLQKEAMLSLRNTGKQLMGKAAPRAAAQITSAVYDRIAKRVLSFLLKATVQLGKSGATLAVVAAIYHNVGLVYDRIYYRKENIAMDEVLVMVDAAINDTQETGKPWSQEEADKWATEWIESN
jgi:hypothetical protein